MKLEIASSDRDHAILVCDEHHNDIAEFYHSDHATVSQSYETALALAKRLVEGSGIPAQSTGDAAHWKARHDLVLQKHIECCGAQCVPRPWKGNLSVDLRKGALSVSADGITLIDEAGVCWAIVFPDKTGSYDHASTIVSALSLPSPTPSPPDHIEKTEAGIIDWKMEVERLNRLLGAQQTGNPVAWVLPGDDNASDSGWLDARIDEWSEFTRPLYGAPPSHAQSSWQPRLAEQLADVIVMLDAPDAYNREYIAAVCRSILSSVASTSQKTPCSHAAIIGLGGTWHCQKCGDAIDMAVAFTATDRGGK